MKNNLFKYLLILNFEHFPFALIKPIQVNRFSLTYDHTQIVQLAHDLNISTYDIINPLFCTLSKYEHNLKLKFGGDTYIVVQPEGVKHLLLEPQWIDNK